LTRTGDDRQRVLVDSAGLAKNTARMFTMFALANLYLVRRRLLAT